VQHPVSNAKDGGKAEADQAAFHAYVNLWNVTLGISRSNPGPRRNILAFLARANATGQSRSLSSRPENRRGMSLTESTAGINQNGPRSDFLSVHTGFLSIAPLMLMRPLILPAAPLFPMPDSRSSRAFCSSRNAIAFTAVRSPVFFCLSRARSKVPLLPRDPVIPEREKRC